MGAPVTTTIQVRATPFGAAIHLTRRALAIGARVTVPAVHQLMADWWDYGRAGAVIGRDMFEQLGPDREHPFTFALRILETDR